MTDYNLSYRLHTQQDVQLDLIWTLYKTENVSDSFIFYHALHKKLTANIDTNMQLFVNIIAR